MEVEKYTFIFLKERQHKQFEDKNIQDLLMKWSMKGHIKLQTYSFNEPFLTYKKKDFVLAFFQNPIVESTLNILSLDSSWNPIGPNIASVDIENIPCTATSMSLFNCLKDPSNNITRCDGCLMQCLYDEIDSFPVTDELRKMLLDPECQNYNLISQSVRNEFLFRLFRHLCLGGQWCQYEDNINAYLDTTKKLYKDIIKVQKNPDTKEITPISIILKIIAKGKDNVAYFPSNPEK
ncbi:hypothetical protein L9F63_009067 [Diploptera punctata]|uniref:Cilia- and flagella-associated protein 300 n=1 Tax=Diploptera punctata TaxID=6984 RepID=A0AAD7Z4U0_DIPPU|nr:hypothetical protein L9F63_009067 [Diploptera punctata]